MKWGVRKDAGHEGEQAKTKKISKLDQQFEKRAGKLNTKIALHNYAAQHMNVHELDRINNKAEYKGKDLNSNPKLAAKYENEVQATYVKHLHEGAAKIGTNASGTKKYAIEADNSREGWHVATTDVVHDDVVYRVPTKRGPQGHIVSLGDADVSDAMDHSLDFQEFLAHHGVLGMKWGNRKRSSGSSSAKVSEDFAKSEAHKQEVKQHGTKALSNKELQELVTRMNLEQQHRNLVNNNATPSKFERGMNHVNKVISVGRTLNDLNNLAKSPVGKAVKTGIKAGKAANAAKKIAEVAAE